MALPAFLASGTYRGLTATLSLIAPVWLAARARVGKEEWTRHRERYGTDPTPRPHGRLIWCHAASVGESLTVLPLLTALLNEGAGTTHILVTTGTVTSARLMAERLPDGAFHRYVPLDHRPWMARFLDHWRPDLILWTESELWTNALAEVAARRIPAALINARLSDKALRGWQHAPGFARTVLSAFQRVLAQSPEDGRRFADLGATDVRITGNLKLAAAPLPVDEAALAAFRHDIANRTVWLAASIHPGEDEIAGRVHAALKPKHPGLLTVIVPRHPPKAEEMAADLARAGLIVARRSAHQPVTAATDIYLADTIGELGLFYRACDVVFMGKSLTVGGGQNPAEPALLGCAVVLGADMSNFRDMTEALCTADAALQVGSAEGLTEAIDHLLADAAARRTFGENARAFLSAHHRALEDTRANLPLPRTDSTPSHPDSYTLPVQ
jgi:3-deoxy-D-manno-octulosonic-acid transferase